MNAKNSLGRRGEQAAVEYMERAGLRTKAGVIAHYLSSMVAASEDSPDITLEKPIQQELFGPAALGLER